MGVGEAHQVHHALHRAVLARHAVERVEHDVGRGLGEPRGDVAVHVDPRDPVPARFQRLGDALAAHQRDRAARWPSRPSGRRRGASGRRHAPPYPLDFPFERHALALATPGARTSSPRPSMSALVASPVLIRKLACFSLTCAPPSVSPRQPAASTSCQALSPGGFLKVEPPVLLRSGWIASRACGDAVHLGADRPRARRRARGSARRRRSRPRAGSNGGRCSRGRAAGSVINVAVGQRRRRNRRGCRPPRGHRRRRSSARSRRPCRGCRAGTRARRCRRRARSRRRGCRSPRRRIRATASRRTSTVANGLAEPHHHARHAAVAHDQVRAEPERHDRRARRRGAAGSVQVVEVGRLEQPVGRAAALEPHQLGERRVCGELAAHVGRHPAVEAVVARPSRARAVALVGADLPVMPRAPAARRCRRRGPRPTW